MQTKKETRTTKRHDPVNEVLVDGILYDVGAFNHPGGSIIRFLQGHGDATEAWREFHARSKKAKLMLKSLPSRMAPKAVLDARQGNGRPELARDFAALRDELRVEGFFDASPTEIIYRISELVLMHCVGAFSVVSLEGSESTNPTCKSNGYLQKHRSHAPVAALLPVRVGQALLAVSSARSCDLPCPL